MMVVLSKVAVFVDVEKVDSSAAQIVSGVGFAQIAGVIFW